MTRLATLGLVLAIAGSASAQDLDAGVAVDAGAVDAAVAPVVEPPAEPELPPEPELPVEEPLDDVAFEEPLFTTRLYGYIDAQYRNSFGTGHVETGEEEAVTEEHRDGFDLNATAMIQGAIVQRYRYFLIFAGPRAGDNTRDVPIAVRNAWVEAPIYQDYLQVRAGKTYRRFGLYNEILDAVPTFVGVEAPEMLVQGHLLATRTTNFMLHGTFGVGDHRFTWSLTTGQDERGEEGGIPIGADLHYDLTDMLRLGSSFYWTGGDAFPTRAVGEGPPTGSVHNWMARDEYLVFGAYAQLILEGLIVQLEYWHSPHQAERDPEAMVELSRVGLFNPRQTQRFWNGADIPTEADINVEADYTVQTFWARFGYELQLGDLGQLTPYLHFEWYSNPEAIADENLGGNEAGATDDGWFLRAAAGLVYRPVQPVALKIEWNPHFQYVREEAQLLQELRISLSYFWELE